MPLQFHTGRSGEIAYYKRGLGDPLLLVHGIYPGASHEEFQYNIDELSRRFTVYAVDLLGFGDSDMPRLTYTTQVYQHLLRELIVEVIGQPPHVIATELSCGPVVSLAVYDDLLLNKLVLIDPIMAPPPPTNRRGDYSSRLQQFLMSTLAMGAGFYNVISSKHELQQFLHSRYANPRHVTPRRINELHDLASQRHAMYAIISNVTGHLAFDLPRWLRYVRNQVLVIWGEHSGPPPTEEVNRPAAWSRGKSLQIIPEAAHWPHDEQSAKVNKLLLEFLV